MQHQFYKDYEDYFIKKHECKRIKRQNVNVGFAKHSFWHQKHFAFIKLHVLVHGDMGFTQIRYFLRLMSDIENELP